MKFAKKQQLYRIGLPKGTLSGRQMPDVLDSLARAAFEPIDDDPSQVSGEGFVSVLDEHSDIRADGIMFGSVWLAGWRQDTRKADKKAAKVLLDREIRNGATYDKAGKKERMEQILLDLVSKAVPIPSTQIVIFDPAGDAIYVQAAKQKKAEEMFERISQALEISWADVAFAEDDGEDAIPAFLEDLWVRSESGNGAEFEPKSVAGEDCVTTSADTADLAFGRVNGKKCASGTLVLDSGVAADLKGETLHAMRIALNLDNAPEDAGEMLGFMAQAYIDAFAEVASLYSAFKSAPPDSGAAREAFERQARRVLP